MKLFLTLVLAGISMNSILMNSGCADAGTDPAKAGLTPEAVAALDALVDSFIKHGLVAGGVAAVERHGALGYSRTFGKRTLEGGEPMTADTIFRIYSMTKPITSTAVMTMYEEGRFDLDDPIAKYLPELSDLKVRVEKKDAAAGDAEFELVEPGHQPTIRELLTHTAGFGYGLFGDNPVEKIYLEAGLLANTAPLAEKIKKLGELPLEHEPGSIWDYSIAVDVLGRLVEVLSGKTLDVYFQEKIFGPLGMVDTGFYVPAEKQDRLAGIYQLPLTGKLGPTEEDKGRDFTKPPVLLMPGGGLVSTANDYLRFCRMMLNGGELEGTRILKEETVDLMSTDQLKGRPISQIGYVLGMKGAGFGLGFAVTTEGFVDTRGSEGEFNWGGAASTIFWIDPKEELIGIYLVQLLPSNFMTAMSFKKAVYRAIGAGQ